MNNSFLMKVLISLSIFILSLLIELVMLLITYILKRKMPLVYYNALYCLYSSLLFSSLIHNILLYSVNAFRRTFHTKKNIPYRKKIPHWQNIPHQHNLGCANRWASTEHTGMHIKGMQGRERTCFVLWKCTRSTAKYRVHYGGFILLLSSLRTAEENATVSREAV